MRIQQRVLDSVVFLCAKTSTDKFHFGGTAFFVSVASTAFPDRRFVYLVTAKHNLDGVTRAGLLHISINVRGGGANFLEIDHDWFYPDTESSDVAVLPFHPDPSYFEYQPIPLSMALTQEHIREFHVSPGEDVIAVGLFTQHYGQERNLPIVRKGSIAMMPIEPVRDMNTGLYYDSYLIEMTSVGGMSGSPVFLLAWPREVGGKVLGGKMFLLGIVRGHWNLPLGEDVDGGHSEKEFQVNSSIASVTPIQDVLTVIHGRELAKLRRKAEAGLEKGSS